MDPEVFIIFGGAYVELGQFDDAWRCIGEAMTTVETTKETVVRGRGHRIGRRNRVQVDPAGYSESEALFRARPHSCASTTSEILGTPRRHEPRAPLARPGQGAASARTARSGLRLVYEGFDTRDLKEAKALLEELAA